MKSFGSVSQLRYFLSTRSTDSPAAWSASLARREARKSVRQRRRDASKPLGLALAAALCAGAAHAHPAAVGGVIGAAGELGAGALTLPAAPEGEPAWTPASREDMDCQAGRFAYYGQVDVSACEGQLEGCAVSIWLRGYDHAQEAIVYAGSPDNGHHEGRFYVDLETVYCQVTEAGRYYCNAHADAVASEPSYDGGSYDPPPARSRRRRRSSSGSGSSSSGSGSSSSSSASSRRDDEESGIERMQRQRAERMARQARARGDHEGARAINRSLRRGDTSQAVRRGRESERRAREQDDD